MFTALFGSSSGPSARLRVSVPSLLFLHCPPIHRSAEIREGNALLSGSVQLDLPEHADNVALSVALVGTAKTRRHGSYEVVKAGPLRLEVGSLATGTHTFAFSLDVPLTSPPTERCELGSIDYAVVATGAALGPSGKDVTASEPLVVNCIPSSEGQPPPGLDFSTEGVSDDFGPWRLQLRSALISVGGILAFSFMALEQPRSIATMGYEVDLVQTIEYTDDASENSVVRFPLYRIEVDYKRDFKNAWARTLSGMESAPAKSTLRVEQGAPGPDGRAGLTLVYMDIEGAEGRPSEFDVVRLPADNSMRASTPQGTLTPFRISHKIDIGYLFSHRNEDGTGLTATTPKRRFNLKRAIHLAPCSCLRGNVTLPTYDKDLPSTSAKKTAAHCVCQAAMPDVVAEQADWLHNVTAPEAAPIVKLMPSTSS